MPRRLRPILIANLLLASPMAIGQEGLKPAAPATDGFKWFGNIGIGGIYTDDSARNTWKLFEYRDLDSGVLSNIDVRGRGERDYVDFFAENIGRTDAYFNARGGRYNLLKYQVYGDWLQHNLSSGPDGARTPYAGVGTSTLTTAFPQLNSNIPPWGSFDFDSKIRNIGGNVELSDIYVSPWYVRAEANQVRTKGVNLTSAASGTSPGNGFVDLPSPVDYVTNNWSVEGGYTTRQGQFAVNFMKSTFTNDNPILNWTNPFFGGNNLDATTLSPDNDLWKISANGALKKLPWSSTLAGRVTYGELTNSVGILGSMLNTGPIYAASNPSSSTFDGKIKTTTASISLTSTPMRAVDSKLYYNYYDRKNESSQITFVSSDLGCPPPGCVTELFGYQKNNAGIDVGYRFDPQNRLSGTIDYVDIDRDRVDYPKSSSWTYGAQWRNSSFDWVGMLLGASYMQRRSDFALGGIGANANDPLFLQRYVARFDASDLDQTRIRLVLDSSPMPLLDLGFEAYWKWNDYKQNSGFDPQLGRTKDYRQEYYANVSYGDPKQLRVTLFGDIEFVDYYSYHRNIGSGSCTNNCFDPNTPPDSTSYNWDATNNDTNWAIGAGMEWKPIERLTVKGSAIWSRTQGSADIVSQNNFGNPLPIQSYDTSSKVTLNLKGVYQYNRHWEFTGGYAFEKYHYSDDQYNDYRYVIQSGSAPSFFGSSYLSGAYAFPNYRANIFYGMVNYKF